MSDVPSRLLRETLREQLAPPSPDCLDAGVLAAWSDGTLNRRDRSAADDHAASCSRCQAMLAAMAKTALPEAPRRWWQTSTVRWLVPIAATGMVAVAVWVRLPRTQSAAPLGPAASFATSATSPPASPPTSPAQANRSMGEVSVPKAETRSVPAPVTAPSAEAVGGRSAPDRKERQDEDANRPQAPAELNAAAPISSDTAAAPAPAPPRQADVERKRALAETVIVPQAQSFAGRVSILSIATPNQDVRWRIVAGTTVERSTDGGATWQAQSIGASARLTAGFAPSPTTCWLVGSGGVVLRSTDGRTWQRLPFPEPVDLAEIRATDAATATVTAADGRVFNTTDGGSTWR